MDVNSIQDAVNTEDARSIAAAEIREDMTEVNATTQIEDPSPQYKNAAVTIRHACALISLTRRVYYQMTALSREITAARDTVWAS